MRNYYVLRDLQVAVVHGPGRRPASEQLFLTFAGPTDVLFSFVAEGAAVEAERTPAAAVSRRPRGTMRLGKRMQDRRVQRCVERSKPARAATI